MKYKSHDMFVLISSSGAFICAFPTELQCWQWQCHQSNDPLSELFKLKAAGWKVIYTQGSLPEGN